MLDVVFTNPWVRALGLILILAAITVLVYLLSPVLVPLFFAFIVAYVLDPVVDFFEKRKISRTVTIAVLALLSLVLLISIPLIVLPALFIRRTRWLPGQALTRKARLRAGLARRSTAFPSRVWLARRGGSRKENNSMPGWCSPSG